MVEIVFCRVTRRGRKKKAGMNKLARENCRNDGPMGGGFVPPDTLKITLDLSDSGPVFSALDDMMMKMMEDDEKARDGNKDTSAAKAALKKLLKSGIPGIEAMFGGEDPKPKFGKAGGKKGYHKLTDASKKKFMAAIFGEEGAQIDSSTAAALLAATCSMGNPEVGNKLAELLMPELDEKVDPAMMAALMSACSMIQTGASTEEVLNIMKLELAASGLTEEEILVKAQLLMKAFGKEGDSTAEYMLMSKQMNGALNQAGLPPKDFTAVRCSLEDVADNMISSLCARGEKTARIIGQVTETLKKTGATAHVVASTMMPPLAEMTGENETSLIRVIGRNLKEVEYDVEEVKSAVTELVLKILDNDPPQYHDAVKALEDTLKELGMFSNDIQEYIKENIPSPPTPPEEIERRAKVAAELARLEAEEEERERMKALKSADPKAYEKEMRLMMAELQESDPEAYAAEMKKNPEFSRLSSLQNEAMGSRRGSGVPGLGTSRSRAGSIVIGGTSRRGSYYDDGTTKRATVAMVTDDPDHKAAMREGLAGAFGDDDASHSTMNGHGSAAGAGAGAGAGGRAGAGAGSGGGAGAGAGGAGAGAGGALSKEGQEKLKQLKSSDPVAYEKEMKKLGAAAVANLDTKTQERLQKLKTADPAAYEKELAKLGAAASTGGVAAAAAAAGGAVAPGAAGAGAAGGALDKAKQDQLKKLKDSDPAAYEKEMKKLGAAAVGSMDKATQDRLQKLQKSDPAAYEKELAKLGSASASGGVQAAAAAAGGSVGPQAAARLNGGGGGVHSGSCGAASMMDSEMAEKLLAAGMEEKYIRELLSGGGKGISPESRALMEQILASTGSQEEIASRVTALLEGTALSGNRGEDTFVGDDGTNLSEARSGNIPTLDEDSLRRPGETVSLAEKIRMRNAAKGARGSVKRQSEIQREKKKSRQEEREEERQRKASYYRKVTGLRRAKVPMMVYSCGGFSRCFRVCRFYDVEGPPVGVEYEPAAGLDSRRELNPDL